MRLADSLRLILTRPPSENDVVLATERISSLGTLQSGLENLVLREHRNEGGLGHWSTRNTCRNSAKRPHKLLTRVQNFLYSRPYFDDVIHGLTTGLGAFQFSGAGGVKLRGSVALSLAAIQLVTAPKSNVGGDGSDQVRFLVNALIGVHRVADSEKIRRAAIWAIALQAGLSYFVSGATKISGSDWRSNQALLGVMRTRAYGHKRMWEMIRKHPQVSRLLEISTIGLEVSYPLAFAGNRSLTNLLVIGASGMHLSIGYFMGLNRFIPAFLSLQPAVMFCADRNSRRASPLPKMYLAAVATVLGAGATVRLCDRRMMKSAPIFGKVLYTASGAKINYEHFKAKTVGEHTQTICFENGLSASKEYWLKIVEEVSREHNCVIYDRPGFGYSMSSTQLGSWQDYEANLQALIEATTPPEQGVVLCGHSMGGHLIDTRGFGALKQPLRATILLDPASPEAYREQHEGDEAKDDGFDRSLRSVSVNTSIGLGWMLDPALWQDAVSSTARARYLGRLYRQPAIWRASRAEWSEYLREVRNGVRRKNHYPVLIIVAGQTKQRNSSYLDTYGDVIDSAPGPSRLVTVEGATHDGLLSTTEHARNAADQIVNFLKEVESQLGKSHES
jgi:pimeloyl-ACP methyl ester carboxylesterase